MWYWSWTLPWEVNVESLLGILIADGVEVTQEHAVYEANLLSIGFLIGRIDIIFNLIKKEE